MKTKLLLFFIGSLFSITSWSQSSVQQAVLLEETFYKNQFLDFVSGFSIPANPGGQIGCDVSGDRIAYFKFTAVDSGELIINIIADLRVGPLTSSYANIYTATDLNVTSDSQLTLVSGASCKTDATNITYNVVAGTSYYILVNAVPMANSYYTGVEIYTPQILPTAEKTEIVNLYNSSAGASWTKNGSWNPATDPAYKLPGITIKNQSVIKIELAKNNLVGTIPSTITNLPNLSVFNVNDNKLSGLIPNFSALSGMTTLNVSKNDFDLSDFEVNHITNKSLTTYTFMPQNLRDAEVTVAGVIGSNYQYTMTLVNGTNVQYQWYNKRFSYYDDANDREIVTGANTNTLTLNSLTDVQKDAYFCIATNPAIPDVEIYRNTIEITGAVSTLERNALIAIYNAADGPNWNDSVKWNTAAPVSEWEGVTVVGNKVTQLEFNGKNLNGTLAPEIGDLLYLQYISTYYGNLNLGGAIPSEIGNLTRMRLLALEYCAFTGALPSTLANLTNLNGLWLDNNQLTGSLPTFIENLPNLTHVDISYNQFQGDLPDLTGLSELQYFNISNNYFLPTDYTLIEFNHYKTLRSSWTKNFYYTPQSTPPTSMSAQEINSGDQITLDALGGYSSTSSSKSFYAQKTKTANQFKWFKDDVEIAGATNSTYVITSALTTDSGVYHCIISNPDIPNAETKTASITVDVDNTLSVIGLNVVEFSIYPNPVSNQFKINLKENVNAKLTIHNLLGKTVYSKKINALSETININFLSEGIYLLKVENGSKIGVKKFIKN